MKYNFHILLSFYTRWDKLYPPNSSGISIN